MKEEINTDNIAVLFDTLFGVAVNTPVDHTNDEEITKEEYIKHMIGISDLAFGFHRNYVDNIEEKTKQFVSDYIDKNNYKFYKVFRKQYSIKSGSILNCIYVENSNGLWDIDRVEEKNIVDLPNYVDSEYDLENKIPGGDLCDNIIDWTELTSKDIRKLMKR